jgi:hypothetical protein
MICRIQHDAAVRYLEKKSIKRNAMAFFQALALIGIFGYFILLFVWHIFSK